MLDARLQDESTQSEELSDFFRIAGSGVCATTGCRKDIPCKLSSSGKVFPQRLMQPTRGLMENLFSSKVQYISV